MMHGREKSDSAIVAGKPTNKAERSAAEPVERRAGAKGNASQQSTDRAQNRATVSQALERVRRVARSASRRHHPRWEPYARIGLVRFCAGGAR
jgi:RNA-directed DNA polymerase